MLKLCYPFVRLYLFISFTSCSDVHRQTETSFESKQLMIIVLQSTVFLHQLVYALAKLCKHAPCLFQLHSDNRKCLLQLDTSNTYLVMSALVTLQQQELSVSVRHLQHVPANVCFSKTLSTHTS